MALAQTGAIKDKRNALCKRALPHLEAALARQPNEPDLWKAKGLAYGFLEDHENALMSFERALELDPENVTTRRLRDQATQQAGMPPGRTPPTAKTDVGARSKSEPAMTELPTGARTGSGAGLWVAVLALLVIAVVVVTRNIRQNDRPPQQAQTTPAYVPKTLYAARVVTIRSGPSKRDRATGKLQRGESVMTAGGYLNGWARISYHGGKDGWVWRDYLSTAIPRTPSPTQPSTVTVTSVRGEALSPFRSGVSDFDITYRVTVKRREGSLMFRLASKRRNGYADCYRVMFCPFADQGAPGHQGAPAGLYLTKRVAGSDTYLAYTQTGFPRPSGTTHLRVTATGSALKVYENSNLVLEAEDSSFQSGRLAWRVFGDTDNPAAAEFALESLSQ